ncbi:M15 family metallopeptidase [Paenarthrobacter sp. DKR-5]|uniref:M15 family metallopeptidase n=1 Tax=Paenarthrobacter sp. DKR-5 TaxID=2835535 RepID=UPI001BDCFABD|nr:M15 family metallopeptidase [Paenarthrobacter sp. DKR-5]MBT1003960.1 M15 family metallopeptidase [Paenarthrobacter sp. DKR-5]
MAKSFAYQSSTVRREELPFTYTPGCPVSLDNLAKIEFDHFDFTGRLRTGSLIVHASIISKMRNVLGVFYEERFPIHTAIPIDESSFQGDDERSMEANNSSAFNFRKIAGTDRPSNHSYGTAIDINPIQNPYHYVDGHWGPLAEDADYTDRSIRRPGMFFPDLPVVKAFLQEGFDWGGLWERADFHHFELKGRHPA